MIKLINSNRQNKTFFVWKAEDIYHLRKDLRIVGALTGVHPYKSGQIKKRHVPLKLMPEEVKLLLDKGLAEVYHTPNQPSDVTLITKVLEKRDQICNEQVALSKEYRKNEILRKCKDSEIAQKKSEEVKEIPKEDTYFQIFTECLWKREKLSELPIAYPYTVEEKVRCAVFKDLWEKKFYITCGSKFGGDFLVYAGDPFIFHALYIVVCLPSTKKIQGFDIMVYGRLGNQVKKTIVLASLNESGNVEYISLDFVPETSRQIISNEEISME